MYFIFNYFSLDDNYSLRHIQNDKLYYKECLLKTIPHIVCNNTYIKA